jgi:hypothetical protein
MNERFEHLRSSGGKHHLRSRPDNTSVFSGEVIVLLLLAAIPSEKEDESVVRNSDLYL